VVVLVKVQESLAYSRPTNGFCGKGFDQIGFIFAEGFSTVMYKRLVWMGHISRAYLEDGNEIQQRGWPSMWHPYGTFLP
jgi:hypothetical protein